MPVREPKGRLLVREVMADAEFMRTYTAAERECYLFLAMFADDHGWLEWNVVELAAAMYRYQSANERESFVTETGARLAETGRLKLYACGHGHMPRVEGRPRAGVQEHRVEDEHKSSCVRSRTKVNRSASVRPPDLTLPNLTGSNDHTSSSKTITPRPRARGARGGPPQTMGEAVGEFKRKVGWGEDPAK